MTNRSIVYIMRTTGTGPESREPLNGAPHEPFQRLSRRSLVGQFDHSSDSSIFLNNGDITYSINRRFPVFTSAITAIPGSKPKGDALFSIFPRPPSPTFLYTYTYTLLYFINEASIPR